MSPCIAVATEAPSIGAAGGRRLGTCPNEGLRALLWFRVTPACGTPPPPQLPSPPPWQNSAVGGSVISGLLPRAITLENPVTSSAAARTGQGQAANHVSLQLSSSLSLAR